MTNLKFHAPVPVDLEGDLASLPGDGARMAPHWTVPRIASRPVSPALIHGVSVPPASARLLDAMEDYGD
ncbi:hypothetical protein SAMN06272771_2096 [Streptomyces sp. Ag82_O1-12]|uniref:hypothetical protein n=1 Tax=unclassified Streptomyces TaxID=2593676 RepID=UPI000BDC5276|nr:MULTISPECIES: hypothetical protein [unclassified Streptomyces]SMQ15758.1 hypothetical protein SAMN06272771_2096 [Streptomyces sp. Ag82_O1-12]SOD44786.1 hypothetical protein SAMN06272727_2089 [Streptomyces sp. Ag82_G6-1]